MINWAHTPVMVTSLDSVSCDPPTRGAAIMNGVPVLAESSRDAVGGHDKTTAEM